jgi:hypothetical protein
VSERPNGKRRAFARLDSGAGLAFSAQMPETKSIADVVASGADLQPHEAVAIVQQLITHAELEVELTPLSPLSLSNVWLGSDGSVVCWACATTPPAVLEMATLLEEMLPRDGKARVPGALRYTMARALLEVDAPPFDSIAQFSAALKRHEKGDRNVVLRELFARAAAVDPHVVTVPGERRRRTPSAELRRQLREADEQLYLHLVSERAVESGPVAVPPVEPAAIEFIPEPRPERSIPSCPWLKSKKPTVSVRRGSRSTHSAPPPSDARCGDRIAP